ncbi:MAG: carboxypeptidase M32 [Clostridiales bacterium]|nr:carboxypeptidase M32 [Clostridiales bacterium]
MKELEKYLERAMACQTALVLLEWDNETLAPEKAGARTARVQGALSAAYQEVMTDPHLYERIQAAQQEELTEVERAIIREAKEEIRQLSCIPPQEYRAFQEMVAESTRIWAKARAANDFEAFAPTLEKIVACQKRFASYRAEKGQKLYDVMLDTYEKGFDMERLDGFFDQLKRELVPFLHRVTESCVWIPDEFLDGDYPQEKQRELAEYVAKYVGFDFGKGVLAVSAHPFTTNLHNCDVRITTHYSSRVDSSLFSVIHECGHAVYEMGIDDELTQTLVGQGASMGMHESQSRFFENILGRDEAFWVPLYSRVKELFPEPLRGVGREGFVRAINRVTPGLIRTEADELTYSLHVLVRYELEKLLIEEDLDVRELPGLWADKYEEYLGVRPSTDAEGVLQDIHWAQGSFGYFPSYALGSAFGAQMYAYMKGQMDIDSLLRQGEIGQIREFLRVHVHRFGKVKTSREILRDMTGEDFNPSYYVRYLKEKYGKLYQIEE